MAQRIARLLLLLPAALVLAAGTPAWSAEARDFPRPDDPEDINLEVLAKERQIVLLTEGIHPRVQRYLSKAAEEVDAERPEEAERLLNRIQGSRLNSLELAQVFRFMGFIAYGDSRPEDAIDYFVKAIGTGALQVKEESGIRYGIAQLFMSIGEWELAIEWFDSWLRYTPVADPNGYYIMAIAYFQLKDVEQAIAHTQKAIEIDPPAKEPWLRLLSALYAQEEDYAAATPVLEELVVRFPQKQYWVQLSLIYAAQDKYPVALAVQQAAYEQDLLSEDKELTRLARSYLYHDIPYPAAELLEREIESGRVDATPEIYELVANSWIAAREYDRSLPPLQKAAALAEDGNLYVRLAQVHLQREEWDVASEMLRKAIEKGELEKPGNAYLLLGISAFNSDRLNEARGYFLKARDYEATKDEASTWLKHVEKETGTEQAEGEGEASGAAGG